MKISSHFFKPAILLFFSLSVLAGCKTNCKCDTDPLKGTTTTTVLVTVKENGMPQVNKETVSVKPGERLVFVGPSEFSIRHREEFLYEVVDARGVKVAEASSKDSGGEIVTKNGVINLVVSSKYSEILKRQEKEELLIKYDVIVNGVPLDPFVRIIEH